LDGFIQFGANRLAIAHVPFWDFPERRIIIGYRHLYHRKFPHHKQQEDFLGTNIKCKNVTAPKPRFNIRRFRTKLTRAAIALLDFDDR
jgi:hypothetical protein